MIFTTPQFVLFFFLFYVVYRNLSGRPAKLFLLAASYFFYGSWNAKFLLLIIASTLLDFQVGRLLPLARDPRRRKLLLLASICGNLGILAFFKYFNFFAESAVGLLGALGVHLPRVVIDVLLPVGISFYTFQTMSYSIDIYRGRMSPTQSLLDFSLYVAFFPQLVAGPIERPRHLLPQLSNIPRPADRSGWALIAMGAFKKVVIADHMAPLVAATYAAPDSVPAAALWLGTYAFAMQIYGDFSGYSDIAVGLGRLMGVDLIQNFRAPYAALNPSDFWQRWHISLSSWLRDYLYIPLGGNRGGWLYVQRNLMLTMLLGGLWHGARWNYVLWGAFHGLLLVAYRPRFVQALGRRMDATGILRPPLTFLRRLFFFHVTCLGWALFRAETLADCRAAMAKLVDLRELHLSTWLDRVELSGEGTYLGFMFAVAVLMVLWQNLRPHGTHGIADHIGRMPAIAQFLFATVLLVATVVLAPESPPPFIYFQF